MSVVLPASGWLMMAKVRRRAASSAVGGHDVGVRLDPDGVVGRRRSSVRVRGSPEQVRLHLAHHVAEADAVLRVGEADRAAGAGVAEAQRAPP